MSNSSQMFSTTNSISLQVPTKTIPFVAHVFCESFPMEDYKLAFNVEIKIQFIL